jgi:hypothetical protein
MWSTDDENTTSGRFLPAAQAAVMRLLSSLVSVST